MGYTTKRDNIDKITDMNELAVVLCMGESYGKS